MNELTSMLLCGKVEGDDNIKAAFAALMDRYLRHMPTGTCGTDTFEGTTRVYKVSLEILEK
jgi:hypothetical protein